MFYDQIVLQECMRNKLWRKEKMLQVSPKGNCFFLSSHELTPSSFFEIRKTRAEDTKKNCTRGKRFLALIKFCQTIKIILSGKKRQDEHAEKRSEIAKQNTEIEVTKKKFHSPRGWSMEWK